MPVLPDNTAKGLDKCGQAVGLNRHNMEQVSIAGPGPRARADGVRPLAEALYAVLNDLRECQAAYGLKARHLTTLATMIGFLKGQSHTLVFASNRRLQERLNNISLRSLQRNLADLVETGMIARRSSPNGKRFALRYHGSTDAVAFGFDMAPLLERAAEIGHLAEGFRAEASRCRLLKLELRRIITEVEGALPSQERLAEFRASLRRKLSSAQLEVLVAELQSLVPDLPQEPRNNITILETTSTSEKLAPSDSQFGTHHHRSDKELKIKRGEEQQRDDPENDDQNLPGHDELLDTVLAACPEVKAYQGEPATSWIELREQAPSFASWVGVPSSLVHRLQARFGIDLSAVAIFCLLQTAPRIRKPGAYLASLVSGERCDGFQPLRWLRRLSALADRRCYHGSS